MRRLGVLAVLCLAIAGTGRAQEVHEVRRSRVEAWRTVHATVVGVDRTPARARLTGLIDALSVDEGDAVREGQVIGRVRAPELASRLAAARAATRRAEAELEAARAEIARVRPLVEQNTASEARLDEAERRLGTAEARVENARAGVDRLEARRQRGRILAPAAGQVLRIDLTLGARVQAGERVAVIAAGPEVLRLAAPERHGPFLREAGSVTVVAGDTPREAKILKVYPEIREGRVRADLEAAALPAPRFTGQRVGVRLPAGTRETIVVPRRFLTARSGLVFARREGAGRILVQTGRAWPDRVEVLSGLVAGDRLVLPEGGGG